MLAILRVINEASTLSLISGLTCFAKGEGGKYVMPLSKFCNINAYCLKLDTKCPRKNKITSKALKKIKNEWQHRLFLNFC